MLIVLSHVLEIQRVCCACYNRVIATGVFDDKQRGTHYKSHTHCPDCDCGDKCPMNHARKLQEV